MGGRGTCGRNPEESDNSRLPHSGTGHPRDLVRAKIHGGLEHEYWRAHGFHRYLRRSNERNNNRPEGPFSSSESSGQLDNQLSPEPPLRQIRSLGGEAV